jgi:hypothetical protein
MSTPLGRTRNCLWQLLVETLGISKMMVLWLLVDVSHAVCSSYAKVMPITKKICNYK